MTACELKKRSLKESKAISKRGPQQRAVLSSLLLSDFPWEAWLCELEAGWSRSNRRHAYPGVVLYIIFHYFVLIFILMIAATMVVPPGA